MVRHVFIFTILFILLETASAKCQAFHIQSFNGNDELINIDDHTDLTLKISFLTDTIRIKDFTGLIDVNILPDKKFLKIDYMRRGGSGIRLEKTIIVSIKENRLIQSLHVTSLVHEEFIDFSKPVDTANMVSVNSTYETGFNLTGNSSESYILDVLIHDVVKFKNEPKRNHDYNNHVILSFDTSKNIFYSTSENLSAYFTIFDPKTEEESKRYILGTFPVVDLGTYNYYFIKGDWYERSDGNYLAKYAF